MATGHVLISYPPTSEGEQNGGVVLAFWDGNSENADAARDALELGTRALEEEE